MNVEIELCNSRYPWNHGTFGSCRCWWKGTIFFRNEMIGIERLVDLVISGRLHLEGHENELKYFLKSLNGSYAFILRSPDRTLCVVDRVRSIPLFTTRTGDLFTVSDDAYYLRECSRAPFNEDRGTEFLFAGYVTGSATLFEGISQFQAGEYLVIDESNGHCSKNRYFHYLHGDYSGERVEQALEHLDAVMMHVTDRLVETTVKQGKTIIVPLSGGLDSRTIVALLKRSGIEDVICFSYGKRGNAEAKISKNIAKTLGYQWYFAEYTGRRWYDCYRSDEMREYERYAANLSSLPVFQDYLAIRVLEKEGKIPEHAVFVPGHTGDMLSGRHIPGNLGNIPHDYDRFVTGTLRRHYSLQRLDGKNEEIPDKIRERIHELYGHLPINDADSLANVIEYFNFNERQAKFIVNSVRAYEFLGYEWRLPLWDSELMDFFLRMPLSFRLNQFLYRTYCCKKLFAGDLEQLSHIPCTALGKTTVLNPIRQIIYRKIPYYPQISRRLSLKYKILTEYHSHPLNWYSIMSRKDFQDGFSGYENINSYLVRNYLKNLKIE